MKKFTLFFAAIALLMSSCGTTTETNNASTGVNRDSLYEVSILSVKTPAQALEVLRAGNSRFMSETMITPHSNSARLDATLNSQAPIAAVVACSDSRVPVELLFDCGIGDIFVIRTAGNSVNDDVVMGSVDYAIDHLNVPIVVVLGHQNCGGVTSAISAHHDDEGGVHHGKIAELLEVLATDVEPYVGHPEKLDEAIHANYAAQVDRIKSVDYVDEKIKSGKLMVVGAYYSLSNGEVTFDIE